MSTSLARRAFLRTAATGGAVVAFGNLPWPSRLQLAAADVQPASNLAPVQPEMQSLVRLLEETPRGRLLEEVAARIRQGLCYDEVLAALLLAGVRNIQPRPSVGFKFHAVLVVNPVHLASLSATHGDRWVPIFWALDHFKESQARNKAEGDWRMKPVDESAVPVAGKAQQSFVVAMDAWDEVAADAAIAGLARTRGTHEVFELLYRYGARDFRSIGHKAIFVAHAERILMQIGWRHAEPVLRSLAYALLMHEGTDLSQRDDPADRPWRRNQGMVGQIPAAWQEGKLGREATIEMLAALRKGSAAEVCDEVVRVLRGGAAPQSIWDALFLGAGELLLRQPGIVALHAVTTTNALHHAYQASGDDVSRRLLLLQNAAFLPMFRAAMQGRGELREASIDKLEPATLTNNGTKAVEEILATVSGDRMAAVGKTLAYLQGKGSAGDFMDAARRLILLKGDDPHDYKFSVAAMEDYYHVSPAWRDRCLAASVLRLRGSGDRDNELVERIRASLHG
jgi:hypothetical protein